MGMRRLGLIGLLATSAAAVCPADGFGQSTPSDYQAVLSSLGKAGDFKDNVLKVNLPRPDLHVTIRDRPVPTPLGFSGWIAFTKAADGTDVMMGDLVLTDWSRSTTT